MNLRNMFDKNQLLLLIGFIVFGIVGRYLLSGQGLQPFPNFEIIMVITFLAAIILRPTIAFFVPLLSMIGSDLLIGNSIFVGNQMNQIVLFTYSGFLLIALLNVVYRDHLHHMFTQIKIKQIGFAAGLGIGFVLIYDIWTNIGWWYLLYPHNLQTLGVVFTAGIPFMIYHLISGAFTFIFIAIPILYFTKKMSKETMLFTIKRIHKLPVAVVACTLMVLSFTGTAMQIPKNGELWLEHSNQTSVHILIQTEQWSIEENMVIQQKTTVFSLLQQLSQRKNFELTYTYYEQFDSYLIESINTVQNGDQGKYWQYYINGEIPMIGADKCYVYNGDSINWIFETVPY